MNTGNTQQVQQNAVDQVNILTKNNGNIPKLNESVCIKNDPQRVMETLFTVTNKMNHFIGLQSKL